MALEPATLDVPAMLAAPDSPGRYGPGRGGGGEVPGRGGSSESDPSVPAQGGADLAALRVQVAVLARDVRHAGALADTVAGVAADAIRAAHESSEARSERDWTRFDAAQEKTAAALEKIADRVAAIEKRAAGDAVKWAVLVAAASGLAAALSAVIEHAIR